MFDSKALKDFPIKKLSKFSAAVSWWEDTDVYDYYRDFIYNFIKRPITQVKKMWGWYWNVFRNGDWDFDGHSLFGIIEYKLKRVEYQLINGNAIQEPQDLKAIKLAIKLAGRLMADNYDEVGHNRIERKWGEFISWFEPIEGSTSSTWHSRHEKEITDEDKVECRKESRGYYEAADLKRKREEKWLFAILLKYLRRWWD